MIIMMMTKTNQPARHNEEYNGGKKEDHCGKTTHYHLVIIEMKIAMVLMMMTMTMRIMTMRMIMTMTRRIMTMTLMMFTGIWEDWASSSATSTSRTFK